MADHNEAMRLADSIHEMNNAAYMTAIANLNEKNRQQAERIAELEGERDKLTQGIAQGLDGQTLLTDLALREGGLYAGIEGGAAGLLAAGFAEQFVEAGGVNYVEVSFTHPKTGPLIVTLQRAQGKTPHKLRVEAEAERDQLRAEVERLTDSVAAKAERIDRLGEMVEELSADALRFRSIDWHWEPERDMGPGGRWWASIRVNEAPRKNTAVAAIDAARTTHKDPE